MIDKETQEYIDTKFKELADAINFKFGMIDIKLGNIQLSQSCHTEMLRLISKMIQIK